MKNCTNTQASERKVLVTTGTGRIGRRIADRLRDRGLEPRIGARSAATPFDWHDPDSWDAALEGVAAVYIAYLPDLVIPGAARVIRQFVARAAAHGVSRLVLLSGRGETEGYLCERIVQQSGLEWTIIRAAWFMENFTEDGFLPMVLDGALTVPARDIPEPFVSVDDIADVAVAALTEHGHEGQVYEVTGPRMLTFADVAEEITAASGHDVRFERIPGEAFAAFLEEAGTPDDYVWLMNYLFDTVLDGRNASIGDGVQRALGRNPVDFSRFAREAAGSGAWNAEIGSAA